LARRKNEIETTNLTLSTTPPIIEYLKLLVATGFWGKSTAEAAERLVGRSIQELIRDGSLQRIQ
jgi:hypothetical protein